MAFQGTQGPDLVSLALNIMQMKRDREMNDRKLALEEFKAQEEARQNAILAQREEMDWQLKRAGDLSDFDEKMQKRQESLGAPLAMSQDPTASESSRYAAARAYDMGVQRLSGAGIDPTSIGAVSGSTPGEAPSLDWEYDESGNKRRVIVGAGGKMTPVPGAVWVPPKAGVTVNVGGDGGLDLNQIAVASRAEKEKFTEAIAPYEALDNAISTLQSFQSMADKNGNLPFEANQFVSSDVMAALRGEALNEGDVKRLTNVGLMNTAKEWVGLPAQMNVKQTNTLGKILSEKARKKEGKRRQLIDDYIYRAEEFKFNPRLIVGKYAKGYGKGESDQGAVGPADDGQIQPMTEADKRRIEKKISKATGLGLRDITAGMVLDAWRAEHGIQSEQGR